MMMICEKTKTMYAVIFSRGTRDEFARRSEDEFASYRDAKAEYDAIDLHSLWERENEAAGSEITPNDCIKKLVANIYTWDEAAEDWALDHEGETLDRDSYGIDEHDAAGTWKGDGWYLVVWSGLGAQKWEPVWLESQRDMIDMYRSARDSSGAGEYNVPRVVYLGDVDEPQEQEG